MITCLQDKVRELIRSFKSIDIKYGGLLLNLDSICNHLAADISKGNGSLFVIDLTHRHILLST